MCQLSCRNIAVTCCACFETPVPRSTGGSLMRTSALLQGFGLPALPAHRLVRLQTRECPARRNWLSREDIRCRPVEDAGHHSDRDSAGRIFILLHDSLSSVRQVWAVVVTEGQVSRCIFCSCGECLTLPTKANLLPLHALRQMPSSSLHTAHYVCSVAQEATWLQNCFAAI